MIARSIQRNFDQDFASALNAPNAAETPTANTKSCITETVKGQILNVNPASNPLLIFLG